MSPTERQAIFDDNSSPRIDDIPEQMLEKARAQIREHIAKAGASDTVDR